MFYTSKLLFIWYDSFRLTTSKNEKVFLLLNVQKR